jgi:hypothetical protein
MLKTDMYVRLEDVLALIPDDDICGPKPSYLRQMIADLPTYLFTKEENE